MFFIESFAHNPIKSSIHCSFEEYANNWQDRYWSIIAHVKHLSFVKSLVMRAFLRQSGKISRNIELFIGPVKCGEISGSIYFSVFTKIPSKPVNF